MSTGFHAIKKNAWSTSTTVPIGVLGFSVALDQNWDRIQGRIQDGRADGALIRVSTPIADADEVAARSRLIAVTSVLDPLLA